MSEFHVEVVRLGEIEKHPNADSLGIASVNGYPVIVRLGEYQPGDLAVYVPVDAVVPEDDPRWVFLGKHRRITAKRLRGVFSMGLLTPAEPDMQEGENVQARMRIEKYLTLVERGELVPSGGGASTPDPEQAADPGILPVYDLEGLRRYSGIIQEGEEVVLTEKLHGASARYVYHDGALYVGSHKKFKKPDGQSQWAEVARRYKLAKWLSLVPGVAIYGEVFGQVQDLKYGAGPGEVRLALFDAYDVRERRFLDYDDFAELAETLGLPTVPVIHRGPWSDTLRDLACGQTTVSGAAHCREGFVVRPVRERIDRRIGRVVLKLVGEDYLLRKTA
jgi:RNA ligase (TIGR02306 family)